MCSYFSKTETESSLAMKKVAEESKNLNLSFHERMKKQALDFLSHRQCSLQEVFQLMPELWLRKTFPLSVFANTNLSEKRYRICKSQEDINKLPEDSVEVFKHNMLDRYMDRLDENQKAGNYIAVANICYAEFLAYYVLDTIPKIDVTNHTQPDILQNDNITGCTLSIS